MAITIDWNSKVINIPKTFLSIVQLIPTELYSMDLNLFRLSLKDLEDSEEGMVFPDTHKHNTEVSLGGLTYARVIEIINGYTITFEDGNYAVTLIGANSNVADVVNVNQVSVRSNNSAGMISSPEIQYATFNNYVTVDINSPNSGTVYPIGTPLKPVNNLDDAILIANYRGFKKINILSDLTITTGTSIDEFTIMSDNWLSVVVEPNVSLVNTFFEKVSLYGVMGGFWNVLIDCWVYDITNFTGWMRGGSFVNISLAEYTYESAGQSFFDTILPMYPSIPSVLIMNTDTSVSFTSSSDTYEIRSMTNGSSLSFGLERGTLIIDSSCTGGDIIVKGIGNIINNSTIEIDMSGLIDNISISDEVWNKQLP